MKVVHPQDPAGRHLAVPGGSVHVVEEGPPGGPLCLLVHGVPGSVRDFRYLGPALAARGVRAVRVDMPGFGQTPLTVWPRLDPRSRAAFLRNVARHLGARRFALLAHSIAGSPCLVAAGLYTEEVSALALVNSVGLHRHRGLRLPEGVASAAESLLAVDALSEPLVSLMRQNMRSLGFRAAEVDALSVEDARVQLGIIGGLDFPLHRAAAREVRCPTLVVSSQDDPLVEPRVSHALADALAGRALQRHLHLAHGGHYLQKHAAFEIAQQVAEMLAAEPLSAAAPS